MISQEEIICAIIAITFLAIGLLVLQKGKHLAKHGKKATGIVFKNNYVQASHNSSGIYYPVVRFLTESNEWITQQVDIGTNPPMTEGKKIEVLYDPNNPQDVIINSEQRLVYLPSIFIVIGICLLMFVCMELLDIINYI